MRITNKLFYFQIVLVVVDLALINIGYIFTFMLRYGLPVPRFNFEPYLASWPLLTLSALGLLYFYRLYSSYRWRWTEIFASILCVVFFQSLFAIAIAFYMRGFSFPRLVLLITPFMQLFLLSVWRRFAWHIERKLITTKRVLVAGNQAEASNLAKKLETSSNGIIKVIGLVIDNEEVYHKGNKQLRSLQNLYPVLGSIPTISACLAINDIDAIYVCAGLPLEDKSKVLHDCTAYNIRAYLIPDFYEILVGQSRLEQVDDLPVFAVGQLAIPEEARIYKRIIDIALSLTGLILFAPILAIISLAIRLDSPGPVIYTQKRLTEKGKPFYLYKFRTMVDKAEATTGPIIAEADDPRITRIGRFLRATRLDELPQLINVLRGEMSLVGPRPERPFFVEQLAKETPEYGYRMNVKSGITGMAQVAGRYSTSPEYKLMYDLLYTRSYSPARDIAILMQTLKVILMKDRAS